MNGGDYADVPEVARHAEGRGARTGWGQSLTGRRLASAWAFAVGMAIFNGAVAHWRSSQWRWPASRGNST
jgi:hypothetical protein